MLNAVSLRFLFGGNMLKRFFIGFAAVACVIAIVSMVAFGSFAADFKKGNYYIVDEELFQSARSGQNTVYYAYNEANEPVEVFNTASLIGHKWVGISEVGENLINAFISAEDREFYKHKGVNVRRTVGAVANYLFRTHSSFGASTITQQVIKNISGDNEASVKRKFNEIMRAYHLEKLYSKDEILEVYLNIVPMSGNISGVGMAAQRYFGKDVGDLTVSEAATIAGITNSPARYDPYKHPIECKEKRNRVLYAMLDNGTITEEEYNKSVASELTLIERADGDAVYSWFIETANNDIIGDLMAQKNISRGAATIMLRGCNVLLTQNIKVQEILEEYFENTDNFSPQVKDGLNYAMLVTDNESGNIIGIIGGVGKKQGNLLLNLTEINVPPASTLKPLAIYAPMIDAGLINAATVVDDTPISVSYNDGKAVGYPLNSPNVYAGLTTVTDAVRLSKNTVAAKLLESYGYDRCANELCDRYGFNIIRKSQTVSGKSVSDIGIAPLALGQLTNGVSLRALTDAYAAFPRDGVYKRGKTYYCVVDATGNTVVAPKTTEKRIYKTDTARIMNQLLMNVTDDGTARSVTLKHSVDTAGKTGTSSGNNDRLFVGYTPYFTAGIWTGYPSRKASVEHASPSHINIWDEVMKRIHEECVFESGDAVKGFSTQGLTYLPYCKDSGQLCGELCPQDIRGDRMAYAYFAKDNVPSHECAIHKALDIDGNIISAPDIQRTPVEGIYIADEEYNLKNLTVTDGFDEEY